MSDYEINLKIKSLNDDIDFLSSFKDFREDKQPDPDLLKALNSAIECMKKELYKLLLTEDKNES